MSLPMQNSSSFLGFVPSMVIQHLLHKSRTAEKNATALISQLPEQQSLKSVVMFADISGFTNLTETLTKKGPEGAEIIAFALNRYMELMVKEIGRSGGDIFKFAGDAMIVVWPPPKEEAQLKNTCRQAVQAALSIQSKLDNMNITNGVKLSVKIGFGVGDFTIIYVGGIFGRAEYLPAGDPLNQAFASEHAAESGGVINCSEQIYEYIKENFVVNIKDHQHKIYQVKKVEKKVMVKADAQIIKDSLQSVDIEKIKSSVYQYIPRSLQAYIQYEQEQWSSELRMVTILFMNIGIDLSDCAKADGLNKIQKVIQDIQKCVYMYEGSLNKFLMDDKGSTLIVVFGLPPITHQDDAVRAVLCSYAIKKQLKQDNCKCSIGVGTGLVFAGVVGTSGNRREYSVLGDSVNLSARMMQKACSEQDDKYKILCSESTVRHASHKISFMYKESSYFKGKANPIPVYAPLDLEDAEITKIDRENKFPSLRTHLFSFPMDPQDKAKKMEFFNYMKGQSKNLKDAEDFIRKFRDFTFPKGCLIISGEMGVGKSLLLRKLIYSTQNQIERNKNVIYKYNERFSILVSNLDPSNKFKKMNIMRYILRQVIETIESRFDEAGNKKNISEFIDSMNFQSEKLKDSQQIHGYIETFKEICGIVQRDYVENFPPPIDKTPEDQFKRKLKEETQVLSRLALEIFSLYFQQPLKCKRKNSTISASSLESSTGSQLRNSVDYNRYEKLKDTKNIIAPLIICLDDLQYADTYSFQIIGDLIKNFNQIFIVGALRDSQLEKPIFPHPFLASQERIFEEGIDNIQRQLNKIEFTDFGNKESELFMRIQLNCLPMDKMKEVIQKVFGLNKILYSEKIEKTSVNQQQHMEGGTQVIDQHNLSGLHYMEIANNTLHNVESKKQQEAEEGMKIKFAKYEKDGFSYLFFSKIKGQLVKDPDYFFHNFIYYKTQGNPLLALQFIRNLIAQDLLLIKDTNFFMPAEERGPDGQLKPEIEEQKRKYNEMIKDVAYITGHLKKAMLLEDLITIDVPQCNNSFSQTLSNLTDDSSVKKKIASVIGDIFDIQTLLQVHPFGNVIKPEKLVETLQALEQQNFLEIVNQNSNNIFYRFSHLFVRETLYQRLIYQQRRQVHLVVAEALQNSISLPHNQEDDIEKLKYQWILGEGNKDISVTELPHKAKRSIIVKRIQSQLFETQNSSSTIIKQDYLAKKSDDFIIKDTSWSTRYVVMNTKDIRYYYTAEDSKDKPDEYLGAIPLRFIYEVNMLDSKEYNRKDYPFRIQASTWYKKTKQQTRRDFSFSACSKEEYEEWYIYLNIAKTKAIQDEFHREYGKVNILKGAQEFDIQLRSFIEQKRVQVSQKSTENNKIRKMEVSSVKSPMSKLHKMKEKEMRKEEERGANQLTQDLTMQQNQDILKNKVNTFLKKGMMLFFTHLFSQTSRRSGERVEFGDNDDQFLDSPGEISHKREKKTKGYPEEDDMNRKLSIDSESMNDSRIMMNMDNSHQLSSVNSNLDSEFLSIKKRVTILPNNSELQGLPSQATPKPKTLRKSILLNLKAAGGQDTPSSMQQIADAVIQQNKYQTPPLGQLPNIITKDISFKDNSIDNDSSKKQSDVQDKDNSKYDPTSNSPSEPQQTFGFQNGNVPNKSVFSTTNQLPNNQANLSLFAPAQQVNSVNQFNAPNINTTIQALTQSTNNLNFNKDTNKETEKDSIQNGQISQSRSQRNSIESIGQGNKPGLSGFAKQQEKRRSITLNPISFSSALNTNTTSNSNTLGAYTPLMMGGSFSAVNGSDTQRRRQSILSALSNNPFLSSSFNTNVNNSISLGNNENSGFPRFGKQETDLSQLKTSHQIEFQTQTRSTEEQMTYQTKKIFDFQTNQSDEDKANQLISSNESIPQRIMTSSGNLMHDKDKKTTSKETMMGNSKDSKTFSRETLAANHDNMNSSKETMRSGKQLAASNLSNSQYFAEGMFKVQALCQSISIKGDFNVAKDEICDASLNRQKKEVVTIHKGNQQAIFLRSNFNFISNPQLNIFSPTKIESHPFPSEPRHRVDIKEAEQLSLESQDPLSKESKDYRSQYLFSRQNPLLHYSKGVPDEGDNTPISESQLF